VTSGLEWVAKVVRTVHEYQPTKLEYKRGIYHQNNMKKMGSGTSHSINNERFVPINSRDILFKLNE